MPDAVAACMKPNRLRMKGNTSMKTERWTWKMLFVAAAPWAIMTTPPRDMAVICSWNEPCRPMISYSTCARPRTRTPTHVNG